MSDSKTLVRQSASVYLEQNGHKPTRNELAALSGISYSRITRLVRFTDWVVDAPRGRKLTNNERARRSKERRLSGAKSVIVLDGHNLTDKIVYIGSIPHKVIHTFRGWECGQAVAETLQGLAEMLMRGEPFKECRG
jgi:hypothetical protein